MARLVRVGDIARELGVTSAKLRQLADAGAIPSERSPGGHRVFDPGKVRSALARLATEDIVAPRWERPDWFTRRSIDGLQEDMVWREVVVELLQERLTQEARAIAAYAFTEMLNNAIDHSGAVDVEISVWSGQFDVRCEIRDRGAGALPHLQARLELEDLYDALGELTKGRRRPTQSGTEVKVSSSPRRPSMSSPSSLVVSSGPWTTCAMTRQSVEAK